MDKILMNNEGEFIYSERQLDDELEDKVGQDIVDYVRELRSDKADINSDNVRELEMIVDELTHTLYDIVDVLDNNDIFKMTKIKYDTHVVGKIKEIINNSI